MSLLDVIGIIDDSEDRKRIEEHIVDVTIAMMILSNDKIPKSPNEHRPRENTNYTFAPNIPISNTLLYTDGVQVRRGTRTDRHVSSKRDLITEQFRRDGISRPQGSIVRRINRIRDANERNN
jgi:hypothetical protein